MTELFRFDSGHEARAKAIAETAEGRTLDVGCGDGYITDLIRKRGLDVVALDISLKRVGITQRQFGLDCVLADGFELPFGDATFDTVIAAEILEHHDPMGPLLAECERVARKQIVVSVPLGGYWLNDPTHEWHVGATILGREGEILAHTGLDRDDAQFMVIVLRRRAWERQKEQ